MIKPLPIVFGCSGLTLNNDEREFFSLHKPLGLILFERNCDTPTQVKALVEDFKLCVGSSNAPILIDQEGGRVARLKPPHWTNLPAASSFTNTPDGKQALRKQSRLVARELLDLGITVNCAPCCDLLYEGADPIIGDRSFAKSEDDVVELCSVVIEAFLAEGLTPTIKHMPGHGRADVDSHEQLPIIATDRDELERTDFLIFKELCKRFDTKNIWGMTAHAVYQAIDPIMCATQSKEVISNVIRGDFAFKGKIISDCITMKALEGSYAERAKWSRSAGCDIVLHCNGKLSEMIEIVQALK